MNDATQEAIQEKIEALNAYSEDVVRGRILFCEAFERNTFAIKEASKAWGIKGKQYAKIPRTFPGEWERILDTFELLTLAELVKLDTKAHRADMAILAKEWRDKSLTLKQVRERVDELMPKREGKPKKDRTVIAAALDDLLLAGQRMSNICYNVKQNSTVDPLIRQSMDTTQREWDDTLKTYRELTK